MLEGRDLGEHVPLPNSYEERNNRTRASEEYSKAQRPGTNSGCLDLRVVPITPME